MALRDRAGPGVAFHWALGCDLGSWAGSRLGGACSSGAVERLTMGGMWPPKDPHFTDLQACQPSLSFLQACFPPAELCQDSQGHFRVPGACSQGITGHCLFSQGPRVFQDGRGSGDIPGTLLNSWVNWGPERGRHLTKVSRDLPLISVTSFCSHVLCSDSWPPAQTDVYTSFPLVGS